MAYLNFVSIWLLKTEVGVYYRCRFNSSVLFYEACKVYRTRSQILVLFRGNFKNFGMYLLPMYDTIFRAKI